MIFLHHHPVFLIPFGRMEMLHHAYCRRAKKIGWDWEFDDSDLNRLRRAERLSKERLSEVRERLLATIRKGR